MGADKTPRADIERSRPVFLMMGAIVALASFFVLMEWRSSPPGSTNWQELIPAFIEDEYMGLTDYPATPEEPKPQEIIPENTEPEFVSDDFEVTDTPLPVEQELLQVDSLFLLPQVLPEEWLANHTDIEELTDEKVYDVADKMPEFPGGKQALIRFIYNNTVYPSVALKQRIEGRVWYSFIVNKDGTISGLTLEQGVYIFLDEEAERVLKTMPDWKPGTINGTPVRVKVYVPIVFKR